MKNRLMVFISAFEATNDLKTNMTNHGILAHILNKSGFDSIECEGMYEGIKELSFMVETDQSQIDELEIIANAFNQHAILVVKPNHDFKALLLDLKSSKASQIGTFRRVESTKGLTGYTKLGRSEDNIYTVL